MHAAVGARDAAAEDFGEALVAQADAQNGDGAGEAFDSVVADTGIGGRAGTGGDDQMGWAKIGKRFGGGGIVADDMDMWFFVKGSDGLDEVVGEGIVIVDDEYGGHG